MKGKLGIMAVMALMTVFLAGIAFGAAVTTCAVTSPATSSTVTGNGVFNVTLTGDTNESYVNCSVTGTSVLTSDTWSVLALNNTALPQANITSTSLGEIDAADWAFGATCYNGTAGGITCTGTTAVTIDNTDPVCTHTQSSNTEYNPTQTWTVTCTNATSATIKFGNNIALAMAESSDVCTFTGSLSTVPEANYGLVTVVTSDGTDTTSCTLSNIKIDKDSIVRKVGGAMAAGAGKKTGDTGFDNKWLIFGLIGVGAYMIYKKKGK